MSEQDDVVQNPEVTETTESTPSLESEEAIALEAQRQKLEEEIIGLEGTKRSILEDVERARQTRRNPDDPSIDTEALKKEIEESVLAKVTEREATLLEQQAKLQEELIKSKKAIVEGINARMASASGSSGQPSSNSIVENEVELSNDEKEIASEVGLKNPRYLKDVEVRGLWCSIAICLLYIRETLVAATAGR